MSPKAGRVDAAMQTAEARSAILIRLTRRPPSSKYAAIVRRVVREDAAKREEARVKRNARRKAAGWRY